MGTTKTDQHTKKIKCPGCGTAADPACSWNQGRCLHRKSYQKENQMALTKPKHTQVEHPNPVKHRVISLAKSALRLAACCFLAYYDVQYAAIILGLAEVLGIAEELV